MKKDLAWKKTPFQARFFENSLLTKRELSVRISLVLHDMIRAGHIYGGIAQLGGQPTRKTPRDARVATEK
jgi:hypothetical protein